ncbi:hypothetical protein CY34DRAFT_435660 [Suillus luteus UH-Slu-Lm8-n1]|uniref:Uncharacterized protein n=1 Tax=Suillus luteus UH-Slu-Lm8-n1 TaxID=930992 RepID=A0A0D0BHP0_9AGAM|nr:hypothetical protein CY34DRAFT_435660 [Suillus luteus UH-Slu-Lm8-n1]
MTSLQGKNLLTQKKKGHNTALSQEDKKYHKGFIAPHSHEVFIGAWNISHITALAVACAWTVLAQLSVSPSMSKQSYPFHRTKSCTQYDLAPCLGNGEQVILVCLMRPPDWNTPAHHLRA